MTGDPSLIHRKVDVAGWAGPWMVSSQGDPSGFEPASCLERAVTRAVATGTYGVVVTAGCPHAFEWEAGVREAPASAACACHRQSKSEGDQSR
jgi:hypothetical protein